MSTFNPYHYYATTSKLTSTSIWTSTSTSTARQPKPSTVTSSSSSTMTTTTTSSFTFLYYALLTPLIFLLFWTATAFLTSSSFPAPSTLRNKRIVLLIAHPDDEAMFFAPTLIALTDPALGNHVKVLCLSNGDADGLGDVRKRELVESAVRLGVRRKDDVFVLEGDERFVDGLDKHWRVEDVAGVLREAFAPQSSQGGGGRDTDTGVSDLKSQGRGKAKANAKAKMNANGNAGRGGATTTTTESSGGGRSLRETSTGQPSLLATIDVLITFDQGGVSNHPNHRALYGGAVLFLRNLIKGLSSGWECPVALYTLPTVNLARKYSGVCDAVVTMAVGAVEGLVGGGNNKKVGGGGSTKRERGQVRVLFVSGLQRYWRAREAMVRAHRSQMVWFRWGWITIGRYMVVNDLKRERIVAS